MTTRLENIRLVCNEVLAIDRNAHDFEYFEKAIHTIALLCIQLYEEDNQDLQCFASADTEFRRVRNTIYDHFDRNYNANEDVIRHSVYELFMMSDKNLDVVKSMSYLAMCVSCGAHTAKLNIVSYLTILSFRTLPEQL